MIEESTEVFWKKDTMSCKMNIVGCKENEMMFEVMTKVKSHVSLGNIVEAVGTIKDLVEKLKDNPRASKQTNRRYKYD